MDYKFLEELFLDLYCEVRLKRRQAEHQAAAKIYKENPPPADLVAELDKCLADTKKEALSLIDDCLRRQDSYRP